MHRCHQGCFLKKSYSRVIMSHMLPFLSSHQPLLIWGHLFIFFPPLPGRLILGLATYTVCCCFYWDTRIPYILKIVVFWCSKWCYKAQKSEIIINSTRLCVRFVLTSNKHSPQCAYTFNRQTVRSIIIGGLKKTLVLRTFPIVIYRSWRNSKAPLRAYTRMYASTGLSVYTRHYLLVIVELSCDFNIIVRV